MPQPNAKRQKTNASYTLLYHGGIPGRGEHIRLAFEAAGVEYSDPGNTSSRSDEVYDACASDCTGQDGNPPCFSPPMLKVTGGGAAKKGSAALLLSQTSNILLYLGPVLGLCGTDEADRLHVNGLTLTALDLNNEAHDTHHPVATGEYYEDQKEEALKKTVDFRKNRIPKFFGYFERVLTGNKAGNGNYLVGDKLTYADTTFWQVVDG
jgi:glutathione S-transferase